MKNLLKIYQENQNQADIINASKKDLLLMLYDGVIENLGSAKQAIQDCNLNMKLEKIDKTLSIIEIGLIATLDKKVEQEVAESLEYFYQDACCQIMLANKQNDEKKLQEVRKSFIDLKKCWESIN